MLMMVAKRFQLMLMMLALIDCWFAKNGFHLMLMMLALIFWFAKSGLQLLLMMLGRSAGWPTLSS